MVFISSYGSRLTSTVVYNMTSVLSGLNVFMGGKDDISFAFLPLSHIYGMTKLMHLPVQEGQTVVIVPKWELESSLAAIQKYKPTLMLLVPPVALLLATGASIGMKRCTEILITLFQSLLSTSMTSPRSHTSCRAQPR